MRRNQRCRILRSTLIGCAVLPLATAAPLAAQMPSGAFGVYGARHGMGFEATAMLRERLGVMARYEGILYAVEKAVWAGVRYDIVSSPETLVYIAPAIGTHYCTPNNLDGTGSGCETEPGWRTGATVLTGFEFTMGAHNAWSIGAETGHRFVEAGERSRWVFAAVLRYRIRSAER